MKVKAGAARCLMLLLGAVVGPALVVGVGLKPGESAPAAAAQPGGRAGAATSVHDGVVGVEPGEPCPGARHAASVDALATTVEVWVPAHRELTDAWTCGSTPVLLYGGVQISYESGWSDVDVGAKWAQLAAQEGGSVESVLGRPAWVHPATADAPRSSVDVVVRGTLVRLLATQGTPLSDVMATARDISVPEDALSPTR